MSEQEQWQGLSDKDIYALYNQYAQYQEEDIEVSGWTEFARAIEQMLKERNHGA